MPSDDYLLTLVMENSFEFINNSLDSNIKLLNELSSIWVLSDAFKEEGIFRIGVINYIVSKITIHSDEEIRQWSYEQIIKLAHRVESNDDSNLGRDLYICVVELLLEDDIDKRDLCFLKEVYKSCNDNGWLDKYLSEREFKLLSGISNPSTLRTNCLND